MGNKINITKNPEKVWAGHRVEMQQTNHDTRSHNVYFATLYLCSGLIKYASPNGGELVLALWF